MPARPCINYYEVLGVPITAKLKDILEAYRLKEAEWRQPHAVEGMSVAKQVPCDDALHILTDRTKKTIYDKLYRSQLIQAEREKGWRSYVAASKELKLWKKSLAVGSKESEANYGRIKGLKVEAADEKYLWAPSLMSGDVVDAWMQDVGVDESLKFSVS